MKMMGVAFIWGVSSSFHKIGIRQTDSLYWGVCETGLICLLLFPFALAAEKRRISLKKLGKAFWPSFFSILTILSYYMAINLGPVAYVSSIRRLGVLFSMLLGSLFLGESTGRTGIAGGITMIAGAVIICLFG